MPVTGSGRARLVQEYSGGPFVAGQASSISLWNGQKTMNFFSTNVGGKDRFMRFFIGVFLLVMASADLGRPWSLWIGLIAVATAGLAWCPSYIPFGYRTCARR